MRNAAWILICTTLVLPLWSDASRADLQDVDPGFWIGSGLLGVTMVASMAGNTVHIAKGDGSAFWGWIGIAAGGTLAIATVAANNPGDAVPYFLIPAGVTAGLGVWSLLLSRRDDPGKPRASGLKVVPGLACRHRGSVEFRIAGTLAF